MNSDKKILAQKIQKISKLQGSFKLRSGQTSHFYFDKYRFESDPFLLGEITDHLAFLIPKETERLAGLELGGIPLATALSLKTKIPCIFVRKKAKNYGTGSLAEGQNFSNKKTVIIEDVITTGGAVVESADELRKKGAIINDVICVIHRSENSLCPKLEEKNIKLHSLFNLKDFDDL